MSKENQKLPLHSEIKHDAPNTDWPSLLGRRVRLKQRLTPKRADHRDNIDKLLSSAAEVVAVDTTTGGVTLEFEETGRKIEFAPDFFYAVR